MYLVSQIPNPRTCGLGKEQGMDNETMKEHNDRKLTRFWPRHIRLITWLFSKTICRIMQRVILRAYETGKINSVQLHSITAQYERQLRR